MPSDILDRSFYLQDTLTCARGLIGKFLNRNLNGRIIRAVIYETEAYDGEEDLACHARAGKTKRTAIMYGERGFAYIYFTYGVHWMLNCVTGRPGHPAAVLIRAVMPTQGMDIIAKNRALIPQKHWTDGPAKLTKALAITGDMNGTDLCDSASPIFITQGFELPDNYVQATPRIGIDNTPEPWKSKPWRFIADLNHLRMAANRN